MRGMDKRRKAMLIFVCSELVISLFIIAMIFVPAVRHKYTEVSFSGLDVIFGAKYKESNMMVFNFSFMVLFPYLLIFLSEVLIASKILTEKVTLVNIIVAVIMLTSGVLFTLTKNLASYADDAKYAFGMFEIQIQETFTLDFGPIAAAIGSIVLALVTCCETIAMKRME